MTRTMRIAAAVLTALAGEAMAQPTITSLGSGVPLTVTNSQGGTVYIGGGGAISSGATRWTLTGSTLTVTDVGGLGGGSMSLDGRYIAGLRLNASPQILGNVASGTAVPSACSSTPTLTPGTVPNATGDSRAHRWDATNNSWLSCGGLPIDAALSVFGSGQSSSSNSPFLTPNNISSDGRFIVCQAYISTYNAAGTSISASSFQWRPALWDSQANAGAGALRVLPTPFRVGSTCRRRTGNPYAVSTDGTVIAGATEHNISLTPTTFDHDGARYCVWRFNPGTSNYDLTYLDMGVDANGFANQASSTPSSLVMNSAGTIIVARSTGNTVTKWIWNAGTQSWGAPIPITSNLSTDASWLPLQVTTAPEHMPVVRPQLGSVLAMSEDGNTIVGNAVYTTGGGFPMWGGFIWRASDNLTQDWYDFNVDLGTPGVTQYYGPIGDNGNPARGLPRLGNPSAISPDGTMVAGFQGGNQRIPGAVPWIMHFTGGPACVTPVFTITPSNQLFSR